MNGDRWVKLPQHLKDVPNGRQATAPYNFVPLPETVVRAYQTADELPSHDRYDPERKTGWIDVTLKTKSPLFIRSAPTTEQYRQTIGEEPQNFREQVKNRPEFFHHGDPARPIIPGSSLRGMLRGVLEIVSYGKVERVDKHRFFFRSMDTSSLAGYYRQRLPQVQAGFLCGSEIRPCQYYRVSRELLPEDLFLGEGPNKIPNPAYQHRHVKFKQPIPSGYRGIPQVRDIWGRDENPEGSGWQDGVLVITGDVEDSKRHEYVFCLPTPCGTPVSVPMRVVALFHRDEQVSQWQQDAFPKGAADGGIRLRPGSLVEGANDPGEPVFYNMNGKSLDFIGRAGRYRIPYRRCLWGRLPEPLRREPDIDYADALFGWVKGQGKQGSRDRSFAGRVCVGDAVPVGEVEFLDTLVPRILATPKPTAFQKYLTQRSDERRELQHYDSGAQDGRAPVIRGHKRYWSQGAVTLGQIREQDPNWLGPDGEVKSDSTQHTRMRPVAAGAEFTFRIWFENLDERELGALCWALCPVGDENVTYVHQLGMGKPLGLGAVEVTEAKVHLTQRPERYETLFEEGAWATGGECLGDLCDKATTTLRNVTKRFKNHILEVLGQQRLSQLSDLPRLQALLALMTWRDPSPNWTADKESDKEFDKERKVLPGVWQRQLAGTDYPAPLPRPKPTEPQPAAPPAAPAPVAPKPRPPAAKAPEQARPALKAGKQNLEVVAVEGRMVMLRLPDGTTFARKWDRYGDPPAVGDPVKVKLRLSVDGTRVEKLDWD